MTVKVCAVTTWPPHHDGVALYSAELYKQIANWVNVEIVANSSQQRVRAKQCKQSETVVGCWKRGLWYPITIFRSVFKTRCNLVHLQHGWLLYGGLVSSLLFPVLLCLFRLSRKPCVVTVHTVIRKDAKIYSNFLVNYLSRIVVLWISSSIAKNADKVVVHNSLMKSILQQEYSVKEEKVDVVPHGVKEPSNKNEFLQESEMFQVLSLGFLRKEKGIECLIEAFKKVCEKGFDAKLVIVGGSHAHDDADYSEDLKQGIPAELEKKVILTGFVDDNTLEQLIQGSDIVVLQSTDPYYVEASGTLAAVANYGKPVVCSKVPKFQSEIETGKQGIVVEPSDSEELTQALVLLMGDKELRKRFGDSLKDKFKNRNWGTVAKEHVRIYERVLKSK